MFYLYEMPPTDYFFPFKTLDEAIEALEKDPDFSNESKRLIEILMKTVEDAKSYFRKHTTWEGDGIPYVLGLPDGEYDVFPELLIMIKQYNNGITYLYSPVELIHLSKFLVDINEK